MPAEILARTAALTCGFPRLAVFAAPDLPALTLAHRVFIAAEILAFAEGLIFFAPRAGCPMAARCRAQRALAAAEILARAALDNCRGPAPAFAGSAVCRTRLA